MPKIRRSKKAPPEGWELIEPTLEVSTNGPGRKIDKKTGVYKNHIFSFPLEEDRISILCVDEIMKFFVRNFYSLNDFSIQPN